MNTTPLCLLIAEDEAAHVEAIRRAFEKAEASDCAVNSPCGYETTSHAGEERRSHGQDSGGG